jgi:hypothetical protein
MQHQFLVFIAEARGVDDANRLASWSATRTESTHAALGVPVADLLALIIARSVVKGVAGIETNGSLERFREPVDVALRAAGAG